MAEPVSKPFPHPERLLSGADFGDTYSLAVTGFELDAVRSSELVFGRVPGWITGLLWVRNLVVMPFGLKTGRERMERPGTRIGIFPVISRSPNQVVLGLDDWHLDFRVLIAVEELGASRQEISVSTAVKTHNLFGRIYLAQVKPFHRVLVPAMLAQVVSNASASPATLET